MKKDISEIFEEGENSIRVAQKTVIKEFLVENHFVQISYQD